jgi:FkbM family methyltransferase|tara:strand:- start:774 stop:1259 length:486 start_codon:yes stop_codon:yes gene_type:complete
VGLKNLVMLTNAKIYAIEPEKDNFDVLSKNIDLNKLKNVKLIKIALRKKKGKVKLYGGGNNQNFGGFSLISKNKNFEMVKVDTFDNLFKNKVKNIDLIKIDVKMGEVDILENMKFFLSNHKINYIIIEIEEENYAPAKKIFDKYNYSFKKIMYNNPLAVRN